MIKAYITDNVTNGSFVIMIFKDNKRIKTLKSSKYKFAKAMDYIDYLEIHKENILYRQKETEQYEKYSL